MAHRLVYHSTLGSGVIQKKKEDQVALRVAGGEQAILAGALRGQQMHSPTP